MAPQKSVEQCKIILQFMETHPYIARGMYKGDKVKLEQFWSDLTKQLNSSGPPTRSVSNWKKIWCDWRRSIKARLTENNMALKKTGGGNYQQHFLSPVEEQLAVICNIFHSGEGISKAKSFGADIKKKNIEFEDDMQIDQTEFETEPAEPQAQSENTKLTFSASPPFTPEIPPQMKKPHFIGDIHQLMDEETKNFKYIGKQMEEMNSNISEYTRYKKHIYKSIEDIYSLKEKKLSEIKRHHLEMEKITMSRNEMKLEFLKLQKMKIGLEKDQF